MRLSRHFRRARRGDGMRLSSKHANVRTVRLSDFSGGLNTTDAIENIGENELSTAINVEIREGQLRVVAGDVAIYKDASANFDAILYDSIENEILLTDKTRKVYLLNDDRLTVKGTLTGTSEVQYAAWEDGMLIASGGKLQYYHGGTLETVTSSPDVCRGVFIKNGRVWTFYEDILKCSAVGDETAWTEKSDDLSAAAWMQVGYKDGGKIVGVCSLSSDTLIFKDNRRAYRLSGMYPNWSLSEIGRQIDCKGYHSCIALGQSTAVLGRDKVQAIRTTDDYGNMQASSVSQKVQQEIKELPQTVRLRYLPKLNQVWLLSGNETFLFFDVNVGSWYTRRYGDAVVDSIEVSGKVYILKSTGLFVLDDTINTDDGVDMLWRIKCKTLIANHNYLLKRINVDTIPLHTNYADEYIRVGHVTIPVQQSKQARQLYQNRAILFQNQMLLCPTPQQVLATRSEELKSCKEPLYGSDMPLATMATYRTKTRCVDWCNSIGVSMWGSGGITTINSISFDLAEV